MKQLDFRVKAWTTTAEGVVEGYASTYGDVDRASERVMPGAFARSLREIGGKVPLLWQHKTEEPVGIGILEDRSKGLFMRAQLDLDIEAGQRAFSAVNKGYVGAFSIGYMVRKAKPVGRVLELHEIDLHEVSLVTVPANPNAVVTGVKAGVGDDLEPFRALVRDTRELAARMEGERRDRAAVLSISPTAR